MKNTTDEQLNDTLGTSFQFIWCQNSYDTLSFEREGDKSTAAIMITTIIRNNTNTALNLG